MSSLTEVLATRRRFQALLSCCLVIGLILVGESHGQDGADSAQKFQTLLEKLNTHRDQISEDDAKLLLTQAAEQGQSYAVSLAISGYLKAKTDASTVLLFLAARNAWEVGELRTAASRYKACLRKAAASPVASAAAAQLYMVLIDLMGEKDEAYQFMVEFGKKFRDDIGARKYDSWFIRQALERQKYDVAAEHLVLVLQDELPVEQEKLLFWELLEETMQQLRLGNSQAVYAALPAMHKCVPMVRDTKRELRYKLYLAKVQAEVDSTSKDDAGRETAFKPVIAAAQAYFQAFPTAESLTEIFQTFSNNDQQAEWNKRAGQKQAFFASALAKLDAAAIASFCRAKHAAWMLDAAGWMTLAAAKPEFLKLCQDEHLLGLLSGVTSLATLKAQAPALANEVSQYAAVVTSLADANGDLAKASAALVSKHSWHLLYDQYLNLVTNHMWPVYQKIQPAGAVSDEMPLSLAIVALGRGLSGSAAMLYDADLARAYAVHAWRAAAKQPEPLAYLQQCLQPLLWIPYSDNNQRNHVFSVAYQEYLNWKKDLGAKSGDTTAADELFKAGVAGSSSDSSKAPTALAKHLAACQQAVRDKDQQVFLSEARAAYKLIQDYPEKRTAFGAAALQELTANNLKQFDSLDLQCEVMADQLARHTPTRLEQPFWLVFENWWRGRYSSWSGGGSRNEIAKVQKVNQVLDTAIAAMAGKDQFWPELYQRLRGTRAGRGWQQREWNQATFKLLVDKQLFLKAEHRIHDQSKSVTWNLMHEVWHNYTELHRTGNLNVHSGFDQHFLAEIEQTNLIDASYWAYGRDEKNLVVDRVAAKLLELQTVPDGKPFATAEDFWRWTSYCLRHVPTQQKLLPHFESLYGKTRFDALAMGEANFYADFDLSNNQQRSAFFTKLASYLDRSAASALHAPLPSLTALATLKDGQFSAAELEVLARITAVPLSINGKRRDWRNRYYYDTCISVLPAALQQAERRQDLYRIGPLLWRIAEDRGDGALYRHMSSLAGEFLNAKEYGLAAAYSVRGMDQIGNRLPDDVLAGLRAVRSQALANIGGSIPVPRSDPRYPVFEAQLAYLVGNVERSWDTYLRNADRVLTAYKDLDSEFVTWLINRNAQTGMFERAETLARAMLTWMESNPSSFVPETRGNLLNAYANIAAMRPDYPRARALYNGVVAAPEFKGTRAQGAADIQIAVIDRLTRNFGEASERLERLAQSKDRYVCSEAFYQLALLKYDQEEYSEGAEYLDRVFALNPEHAGGRILQGNIFLQRKQLEEASELDLGIATTQRILVPGTPLKIKLEDRNLSLVGKTSNIEIRAWTKSGDEEFFGLLPFGDSRTKFEGRLMTELAPVNKGDHILQVLGQDEVFYDFSDKFKVAHNIQESEIVSLRVTTDSSLQASSGKILTEAERREESLEQLIRQRLAKQRQTPRGALSLVKKRAADEIKPGNPINVQVIDPDRSLTNERDTVTVSVSCSSGDRISGFVLNETDTHSGIFEGAVPTTKSPAVAYASDSMEGHQAIFPISRGDHPAWIGEANGLSPKVFTVDMNDNVALGKMNIIANVANRRIKEFTLQTSLDGETFVTRARWPGRIQPWDGSLRLQTVKVPDEMIRGLNMQRYVATDHMLQKMDLQTVGTDGCNVNTADLIKGMRLGEKEYFVTHLRGAFYLADKQQRSLSLQTRSELPNNTQFLFLIDGKPSDNQDNPLAIRRSLSKGVHVLDVYCLAPRLAAPRFAVVWDIEEPPYLAPLPAELFDLGKHPLISKVVYEAPAAIRQAQDGGSFSLAFAESTRARIIRLLLHDFEGDAPAIAKIMLTDQDTQVILPSKDDLLAMRKNQQLEIIPGDDINIVYNDQTFIAKRNEIQEAFLTCTFTNADLSACFPEYGEERDGERELLFIPMRRFKPGDAISIFIKDPDMDVSDERDTVVFTVETLQHNAPVELAALETEPHSGVFIGKVFPVTGPVEAAKKSQIVVSEGDDITFSYFDKENTDYGIPWKRTYVAEQTSFITPELRVFASAAVALDKESLTRRRPASNTTPEATDALRDEVPRSLVLTRPEAATPAAPAPLLIDGPMLVELLFPTIAMSPQSTAKVHVQTQAGREADGATDADGFDPSLPSTRTYTVHPNNPEVLTVKGYEQVIIRGDRFAADAVSDGRFMFSIPLELGDIATATQKEEASENNLPTWGRGGNPLYEKKPVVVRGNDVLHIGFSYTDEAGQEQWLIQQAVLASSPLMAAMDRHYDNVLTGVYVGESVYFRVLDQVLDKSNERDAVTLSVSTESGQTIALELLETFEHTGDFRGVLNPVFADPGLDLASLDANSIAVTYGDTITATYKSTVMPEPMTAKVIIHKGGDGDILTFTKRFQDPEIAIKTQFTIAEAFFELAKKHRGLGQEQLARREIAHGKKLLEEALRDNPQTEVRAQADYLLANLALEFANDTVNEDVQKRHYMEAVNRFTDIVASYPESAYAPKSQYKKALVFEKMDQFDQACDEYVKLSYRYPDNELVAETMARLGQYFWRNGRELKAKADAQTDEIEAEKARIMATDSLVTAGDVFNRMSQRFPNHHLASKALVLSGQAYMMAEDYTNSVLMFNKILSEVKDDPDLLSESMYWCADSYSKQNNMIEAYRMFKRLTWDYPASKWAKYARGRLTDKVYAKMDMEQ